MTDPLRDAASRALRELGDAKPGAVTRVVLDVALDGRAELVTFALEGGALRWSTSGTDAHVATALAWLADGAAGARATPAPEPPLPRLSWPPGEPTDDGGQEARTRVRLADALDDVVTTIVRVGVAHPDSPSIAEGLERLRRELPLPAPLGVSRWLGRLRAALDAGDVAQVARLLDGASRLAEELRRDRPTPEARRRAVAWLGATSELGGVERISDRTLVEVAREHLPTSERGGIERRYLVDLRNGEVFREERARTDATASVGPCPRVVQVGLAEVERGGTPRRIRLMQYVVTLDPGRDELRRIEANAYRRFAALADRYREWLGAEPGQAEPFVIVAPKTWKHSGEAPVGYDDEGVPLGFARADDPAAVELLDRLLAPAPRWVGGRIVDVQGRLLMVPCVLAAPDGEGTRLHRLR
ncbi:MAG: hypothetical protein KF729_21475 [Sandaracinaceae bacterium]|nr:hypothetical protein [Sandaracinaceae bacterium]